LQILLHLAGVLEKLLLELPAAPAPPATPPPGKTP
jgi:hypothetical protein